MGRSTINGLAGRLFRRILAAAADGARGTCRRPSAITPFATVEAVQTGAWLHSGGDRVCVPVSTRPFLAVWIS